MKKREIFDSFLGKWHITRRVGQYGIATGIANYVAIGENSILYREEIYTDLFSGKLLHFYKEYNYCYNNHEIEKYFVQNYDGNKFFYKLEFSGDYSIAKAVHQCNQDFYQTTYSFHNHNNLNLRYSIQGAKKNYIIETGFIRLG